MPLWREQPHQCLKNSKNTYPEYLILVYSTSFSPESFHTHIIRNYDFPEIRQGENPNQAFVGEGYIFSNQHIDVC